MPPLLTTAASRVLRHPFLEVGSGGGDGGQQRDPQRHWPPPAGMQGAEAPHRESPKCPQESLLYHLGTSIEAPGNPPKHSRDLSGRHGEVPLCRSWAQPAHAGRTLPHLLASPNATHCLTTEASGVRVPSGSKARAVPQKMDFPQKFLGKRGRYTII